MPPLLFQPQNSILHPAAESFEPFSNFNPEWPPSIDTLDYFSTPCLIFYADETAREEGEDGYDDIQIHSTYGSLDDAKATLDEIVHILSNNDATIFIVTAPDEMSSEVYEENETGEDSGFELVRRY